MSVVRTIQFTLNGDPVEADIKPHHNLVEVLQNEFNLMGARESCGQGLCGCCTVLVNGKTARSCLMFAVQADGSDIMTIEGLARGAKLHPIQEAFREHHGLQCGYCTPGMLATTYEFLKENPDPTEEEARKAISGVLCRCTGYKQIIDSVMAAADKMRGR